MYPYLSVCILSEQNISKSVPLINFIFGGSLPSDLVIEGFDFEKYCPGVRVSVGVQNFG